MNNKQTNRKRRGNKKRKIIYSLFSCFSQLHLSRSAVYCLLFFSLKENEDQRLLCRYYANANLTRFRKCASLVVCPKVSHLSKLC